jgi:hypothetical protein
MKTEHPYASLRIPTHHYREGWGTTTPHLPYRGSVVVGGGAGWRWRMVGGRKREGCYLPKQEGNTDGES